jgi:hypothetical protein
LVKVGTQSVETLSPRRTLHNAQPAEVRGQAFGVDHREQLGRVGFVKHRVEHHASLNRIGGGLF